MSVSQPAAVVILAAGEGTRMKSAKPKVLHDLAGRTLLGHAVNAAAALEPRYTVAVVRHGRQAVVDHLAAQAPDVVIADQDEIPGTGRAVQCALARLDAQVLADIAKQGMPADAVREQFEGPMVVMTSDAPLVDGQVLSELFAAHAKARNDITVLTTHVANPNGYGRILRDEITGEVTGIVEHRDASQAQRTITEINSAVYVFDTATLRAGLNTLTQDNDQGELLLTDVLAAASEVGKKIGALVADDPWVAEGVNDRVQLAAMLAEMNRRILTEHMLAGVTIIDPATTWVEATVTLERDVTLLPGTNLTGTTTIGEGATIGPDTMLRNVEVGAGAQVIRVHGTDSIIHAGANVGPFSYLRPGTELGERGKIGAFVETKNAQIGTGSKVPHLSYVGDATIGEGSNIGAATIFVNYDGVHKHRSTVGSHVRIGSDNMLVAPITIGDGAYTGAGSVIRRNVPAGALGVNSSSQRNIEEWVLRRRPGTPAAEAAQAAIDSDHNGPADTTTTDTSGTQSRPAKEGPQ